MNWKYCYLGLLFVLGMSFVSHSTDILLLPRDGIPFDGGTAYLMQMDDMSVDPTAFSVSAWVCPDRTDRSLAFLSMGGAPDNFTFYFYNGAVRMLVANNPPTYNFATAKPPVAGEWTHFLGTYDGETICIYENGVLTQSKSAPGRKSPFDAPLCVGGIVGTDRSFSGKMTDLCVWNRALAKEEALAVYKNATNPPTGKLVGHWTLASVRGDTLVNLVDGKPAEKINAVFHQPETLMNAKDTGFRGLWYYNQKLDNEYVFKYSGGLGTYPANHYPFSIYAPEVDKTFFCYGGTDQAAHDEDAKEGTLLHEVSYYDHKTGKVARPTIVLDKKTSDAHDNPVMSIDEQGYIWIFSTSHGTGRPSWISRSKKPYDIDEFELVPATKQVDGKDVPLDNFSYFQVWNVPGKGFITFFTTYDNRILNDPNSRSARTLCFMTSRDGVTWSAWQPIAGIMFGHYQNGAVWQDKKVGSAFNYHPNDPPRIGLNYRTNLYYVESEDFGATWQTAGGKPLEMPLRDKDINCPALIRDYRSQQLNVYVMDLVYDEAGHPVILYMTSKGFESGPENGPRIWRVAGWNGESWDFNDVTESDNNYDYGSIFMDQNGAWHIVGTPGIGPQAYNTGGEVSLWVSCDRGKTWTKERQMTDKSELNHCYPRRTINAHPDFYAIWADGHGRQKSKSRIYFCNDKGDVFRLPEVMTGGFATPEKIGQ